MRACLAVLGVMLGTVPCASAQFDVEDSHTTASLRGIHALGAGVAWASGSKGTVLRTEDGGSLWQTCAMPKGAEKLDFRGVQGFDAKTAVVMSSGPGVLSKVYKTTDGCQTWKLVFENPDESGFFDSLRKVTSRQMYLLGDPVKNNFAMFYSPDAGDHWFIADDPGRQAAAGAGAFAASNTSLASAGNLMMFGVSAITTEAARVYRTVPKCAKPSDATAACALEWVPATVPLGSGSTTAGVYSLGLRTSSDQAGRMKVMAVAVGGNFQKPDDALGTAAYSSDGGEHWLPAKAMPGGYRSGLAYDGADGRWIAVGPNGTDVSRDDGATWTKLQSEAGDPPKTGAGWNAVSLPFVVGNDGRIGKLRDEAKGK